MAFSFIRLSREQDPNKRKDLLVNTERHMYINLPNTLNSIEAINGFRFYLSQYGVWNPKDKIVRTARPQNFFPPSASGYVDISFMVRLYDEHCDREEAKNRADRDLTSEYEDTAEDFEGKREKFETWSRSQHRDMNRNRPVPSESKADFVLDIPIVPKSKPANKKPITTGYLNDLLEAEKNIADAKKELNAHAKHISVQYLKNPNMDHVSTTKPTAIIESEEEKKEVLGLEGVKEGLKRGLVLEGAKRGLIQEGAKEDPVLKPASLNSVDNTLKNNATPDSKALQVMSSSEIIEEHGIHLSDQSNRSEKQYILLDPHEDPDDRETDVAAESDLSVVKSESETEEESEESEETEVDVTESSSDESESDSVQKKTVTKKKPAPLKRGATMLQLESDAESEDSTDGKEDIDDDVEDESDDESEEWVDATDSIDEDSEKVVLAATTKKPVKSKNTKEVDSEDLIKESKKLIKQVSLRKSFEPKEDSEDSNETESESGSHSGVEVELLPKPKQKKNTAAQSKKPPNKSNATTSPKKAPAKKITKKPPAKPAAKPKPAVNKATNPRSKVDSDEKPIKRKPKKK